MDTLFYCGAPERIGGGASPAAAAMGPFVWPATIRKLRVRFMGGSPTVRSNVRKVIDGDGGWNRASQMQFVFSDDEDSEIRVSFVSGGSWAYEGTSSVGLPYDMPTVNFGWLTDTTPMKEYERLVLHETGHSLALIHEHQSPLANIPWDIPAVYKYYGERGWDKTMVDAVVLTKVSPSVAIAKSYDRFSIMHYGIPDILLTDKTFVAGSIGKLTETDKATVARLYGAPPPKVEPPAIVTPPVVVKEKFKIYLPFISKH